MSRELSKMTQALTPHIASAIDASKEASFHMEKAADAINKLGNSTASIHKTYKTVADKFDFEILSQIESVYAELSKTLTSYSKILLDEKDSFSTNIENFFSFCTSEIEGIDEVESFHPAFELEKRILHRI